MQTIINQEIPQFSVEAFVDGNFKKVTDADLKGKCIIGKMKRSYLEKRNV